MTQREKTDKMQAWLVTNNPHHAQYYLARDECETAVEELRSETGWDWIFHSWFDEGHGSWTHMPCILSGRDRLYLFPR